jgi:hypothetical protein
VHQVDDRDGAAAVTERPRSHLADACYLAGGAALVASAFVHWVSRGPGSGLRGHELVDAVVALGRHVPALSNGRLTVVWYLVPAIGAAAWIVCGITGARSTAARAVGIAGFIVALLALVAFGHMVGVARLGWGPKVAMLGAVLLCAGAWFPLPRRSRLEAGPSDTMTTRACSSVVRAGDS